jgi:hypothetical protein
MFLKIAFLVSVTCWSPSILLAQESRVHEAQKAPPTAVTLPMSGASIVYKGQAPLDTEASREDLFMALVEWFASYSFDRDQVLRQDESSGIRLVGMGGFKYFHMMQGNPVPVHISFKATVELHERLYRYHLSDFQTLDGSGAHFNFDTIRRLVNQGPPKEGSKDKERWAYDAQVLEELDAQAQFVIASLREALAKKGAR